MDFYRSPQNRKCQYQQQNLKCQNYFMSKVIFLIKAKSQQSPNIQLLNFRVYSLATNLTRPETKPKLLLKFNFHRVAAVETHHYNANNLIASVLQQPASKFSINNQLSYNLCFNINCPQTPWKSFLKCYNTITTIVL